MLLPNPYWVIAAGGLLPKHGRKGGKMDVDRVLAALDTFTTGDLAKVRAKLDDLQGRIEGWQEAKPKVPKRVLKQERVTCGKVGCKTCQELGGHGPYWYSYWSEGGRTRKQYHGKEKPNMGENKWGEGLPEDEQAIQAQLFELKQVYFSLVQRGAPVSEVDAVRREAARLQSWRQHLLDTKQSGDTH